MKSTLSANSSLPVKRIVARVASRIVQSSAPAGVFENTKTW